MNPRKPKLAAVTEPGRFKGCPPICLLENLPSHKSPEDAARFHKLNGPRCTMDDLRHCTHCNGWHYDGNVMPNNQDRKYTKLPVGWKPFMRSRRPAPPTQTSQPELRRQPATAKAKSKPTSTPKPAPTAQRTLL